MVRTALSLLLAASICTVTTPVNGQDNHVTFGAGYQDTDRFRYGQFSGQPEAGGFSVGSFRFASPLVSEDASNWMLEGENLGLDNGRFSASYRQWGKYSLRIDFAQLPQAEVGEAWTPFLASGNSLQTLPSDWTGATSTSGFTTLDASLMPVAIDKQRKRITGALEWQARSDLNLSADFRHETKRGTDTLGAIFGSSGGNPRGALLRRPVDFDTWEMSLALDRSGAQTQYGASYTTLRFNNKENTLRWQNPFNNPQWIAGAGFSDGAYGQLALEPDNRSHQVNAYLGRSLGRTTRMTLSFSRSLLEQDTAFLPYSSVVDTPVGLPTLSLDGRVEQLAATLNLTSRLNARTTLRARYRFRDRDNETDQFLFLRVAGDAAPQAEPISSGARVNRLYDQQTDEFSLALDHRLASRTRVSIEYENREKELAMVDAQSTTEQQLSGKLSLAPLPWLDGWIKLSRSERKAESYDTTRPLVAGHNPDYVATLVGNERYENDPFLRRYSMTDRKRTELMASSSIYPNDRFGLTLLARLAANDYPGNYTGVQRSDLRSIAADLSYTPGADWTASLYVSEDRFRNRQYGYARSGGGNPTPVFPYSARNPSRDWRVSTSDRVLSLGATWKWAPEGRPYDLELNLNESHADTETAPYSNGQAWLPLPQAGTDLSSLTMDVGYRINDDQGLKLRYFYEDYDSDDFALDQVLTDSLSNILLLGNESPSYAGHGIMIFWEIGF